jgi:hypothetical protein
MVLVLVHLKKLEAMYQQMTGITLPGKLSAVKVKQAKPANSTYKLSDGHGLYLVYVVKPNWTDRLLI